MKKAIKIFFYLIACIALFLILLKTYQSSFVNTGTTASAFDEWEKSVNVYFSNAEMGSAGDCSQVFPVARTVINAETLGPGSIQALLSGLKETEKASGYSTNINEETLLQAFSIKDGVAYVDFNQGFSDGVAGSCRVQAIRSQIEKTLVALPDINSVVISVNGATEGILEP